MTSAALRGGMGGRIPRNCSMTKKGLYAGRKKKRWFASTRGSRKRNHRGGRPGFGREKDQLSYQAMEEKGQVTMGKKKLNWQRKNKFNSRSNQEKKGWCNSIPTEEKVRWRIRNKKGDQNGPQRA